MTPVEFVLEISDIPADKKLKIGNKNIKIFSSLYTEWEVLSYYHCPERKCMVLDIGPKRHKGKYNA